MMAGDVTIECERSSCIYNEERSSGKAVDVPTSTGSPWGTWSTVRICINRTLFLDAKGRCRCFVNRFTRTASGAKRGKKVDPTPREENVEPRDDPRNHADSPEDRDSYNGDPGEDSDEFGSDEGLRIVTPDEGIKRIFRRKKS